MTAYWIGTSGYNFDSWRGSFYPPALAEPEMLRFYGQHLVSVESNLTFYKLPNIRTVQAWARDVPEHFTFSLKAPRRITHDLKLRDASDAVTRFCDTAKVLKTKLGVVLFQLPSFLKKEVSRLEDFLHQLAPGFRVAFEFRNPSWFADDVFDCLRRFDAALCLTEHPQRSTPFEATASFGYLRLRRPDYDDSELDDWAERLRAATQWKDAFVYFKQEAEGRSPVLAMRLAARLQPQPEAERYLEQP